MPRVALETPQTYDSITRPVALGVVRQIFSILSLPQSLNIVFPGAAEQMPMTGSMLNDTGDPTSFRYGGQMHVEVTENPVEDRVLATAVYQRENLPVFVEPKLGVKIHPIYSGTEMVLTCQYRAPNRVLAKRFRDDALIRTAMGRKENLHELTYHYSLPYEYLHLLKSIYDMREEVAGYGESFDKWMVDHITQRATNITTMAGTQAQLVIAEHQVCPQGYFDFSALPEPESKDKEGGTFVLNFEYRMVYDKVVGSTAQWPLVVHNQLVDEQWRSEPNASGSQIDPARRKRAPSLSRHSFDHFTNRGKSYECRKRLGDIRIPHYDDWEPATVHPTTSPVVSIMLMVDVNDPTAILNLKELGDYTIDPDILAYLVDEAPYLGAYGQSAIYLSLYKGDVPLDDGALAINSNLTVTSTLDLDPRERYHLRIAIMTDFLALPNAAAERLRTHGKACIAILSTLQWQLFAGAWMPKLIGGTLFPRIDFLKIAQRISDLKNPRNPSTSYHMQTVGNFLIVAHRLQDLQGNLNADHESGTDGTETGGSDSGQGGGEPVPNCSN